MKRLLLILALLLVAAPAFAAPRAKARVIKIQVSTFPATLHATWNPNAASDNVTAYLVTVGSASPISVSPSVCTTTCVTPITIPSAGTYAVVVGAQNQLCDCDPTTLQTTSAAPVTIKVSAAPGTPTGTKVGK